MFRIGEYFIQLTMVFFRVILRKRRSVVFRSFTGKSNSDNPRAISEALHDLDPSVEIVWLFKDPIRKKRIVPEYVKCVKHASLAGLKELARSAVWVDKLWQTKMDLQNQSGSIISRHGMETADSRRFCMICRSTAGITES